MMKSNLVSRPVRLSGLLLFILVFVFCQFPATAQQGFDAVVQAGAPNPANQAWSSDSQRFVFSGTQSGSTPLILPEPGWYQYDLTINALTTQTLWPLQPMLTSTELDLFKPDGFIYNSPDNNLLLYTKNISPGETTEYAIANRALAQDVPLNISSSGELNAPEGFTVHWGDNSAGLAFSYDGEAGQPDVYYTHLPDPNSEFQLSVKLFRKIVINNLPYSTYYPIEDKLYDVSADGSDVLLVGHAFPEDAKQPGPSKLIVWTPNDPSANGVVTDLDPTTIRAASFAPSSSTKLLILNEQADLLEYDLITGQSIVLRTQLITSTLFRAWFSPKGQWLAIDDITLYFLNIGNLLAQLPTETPTNAPTEIPTANQATLAVQASAIAEAINIRQAIKNMTATVVVLPVATRHLRLFNTLERFSCNFRKRVSFLELANQIT